jgi:SAM-dependent methyltransferase
VSAQDHFNGKASPLYAAARPTYPESLFNFIAFAAPGRERAWDCATGNGQAARGLARHFTRVDATDVSAEQVAQAPSDPRVVYAVQTAESPAFEDRAFDAVCVAQALHWLDLERFYPEVRRVLRPGGLFAAWGYVWSQVEPRFDDAFEQQVLAPLHPFWPAQNRKLWNGYRDLPFPFMPVAAPVFTIEIEWTLDQYLGYAATWSATRELQKNRPAFLEEVRGPLAAAWGSHEKRCVTMPLHVRVGRHEP